MHQRVLGIMTNSLTNAPRLAAQVPPRLQLPSKGVLAAIGATFGPATLLRITKSFIYLLIQSITTALPTLQLAAHQPIYGLWSLVRP
jgi:hypothetical protein